MSQPNITSVVFVLKDMPPVYLNDHMYSITNYYPDMSETPDGFGQTCTLTLHVKYSKQTCGLGLKFIVHSEEYGFKEMEPYSEDNSTQKGIVYEVRERVSP